MLLLLAAAPIEGAILQGRAVDPSGQPVPHAQISLVTPLKSAEHQQTDPEGRFAFAGLTPGTYTLFAKGPGLASEPVQIDVRAGSPRTVELHLKLSALEEHVVVSAQMGAALATETGAPVTVLTRQEMEAQGQQLVLDALRQVPGVAVSQTGRYGGVTGVFIRGGNSNYNLVMVNGIQLNQFGGDFDFAPLTVDGIERVEVIRSPESALYGSNAVAGVINIVTPRGEGPPRFSLSEELGSFNTWRIATGASGRSHGLSWSAGVNRLDSGGVVTNDDYRDQTAMLDLSFPPRGRSQADLHFYGNANDAGAPGPYGSDPDHLFTGLDTVSRDKQNLFGYGGSFTRQLSSRFQQVVTATLATNDYYFRSPFGDSFSNNLRSVANTRSEVLISNSDFLVAGFEYNREQIRNAFITDASNKPFTLPRTSLAYFAENRWNPSPRLFLTTGLRADNIRTAALPPRGGGGPSEPLPSSSILKINPRLAAAYLLRQQAGGSLGATRLHSSFGTGIRAPDGFELAFTDNPHLKPEKSVSWDAGLEQRFLGDRALVDATYFYDRFEDQIVTLGGSLTHLSSFISDNLGNSRARGVEVSARLQPARSLSVSGAYTLLDTAILSLNGASLVPPPFRIGQELLRRPHDSASYSVTWRRGRWLLETDAYVRGSVLDLEPNYGTFACSLGLPCLFSNPGYLRENAGFSYRFLRGLEVYGRFNNLFNRRYEEALGFPALRFNFFAGMRFHFPPE